MVERSGRYCSTGNHFLKHYRAVAARCHDFPAEGSEFTSDAFLATCVLGRVAAARGLFKVK